LPQSKVNLADEAVKALVPDFTPGMYYIPLTDAFLSLFHKGLEYASGNAMIYLYLKDYDVLQLQVLQEDYHYIVSQGQLALHDLI